MLFDLPFKDGNFGVVEWVIIGLALLLVILVILLVFGRNKKENTHKELINDKDIPKVNNRVVEEEVKQEEVKKEEVKPEPKKVVLEESLDYHVTYFEEADSSLAGKWRVVRENSQRPLKYFRTQQEAIDYANEIANNQGVGVVVHRKDGKIRKS